MGLTRARQLGLDYASLSKVHSRLVFCGITPFGENGPLSLKPADDNVVAAFSGTIAAQGGLGQPPVFVFIPLASYATAMLTAYGASLALFVREATGKGQQVHASLLGGTLAMDSGAFLSSPKIVAVPLTRGVQQGAAPAYRLYECADGEWIMIACGNTTFWNKLCLALDRTELLSDARFQGMPWGLLDIDSRLALTEILGGILQQHSRVYWLELLSANDVPCSPVITRQEFMDDPQVKHNGMMVTVRDPYYGDMRQPGIPITLTGNPSAIKCPAPVKGQHTGVILAGFGYSPAQVRELDRKGAI
jgi:crotonobetainyl-CoA:carnitine CoA-transferase CaiB-like acyl-CoA transferase